MGQWSGITSDLEGLCPIGILHCVSAKSCYQIENSNFDQCWSILIPFDPCWSIMIHFDPCWSADLNSSMKSSLTKQAQAEGSWEEKVCKINIKSTIKSATPTWKGNRIGIRTGTWRKEEETLKKGRGRNLPWSCRPPAVRQRSVRAACVRCTAAGKPENWAFWASSIEHDQMKGILHQK